MAEITAPGFKPMAPVRWRKADPDDYGKPTTVHLGDPNVKTIEQLFSDLREQLEADNYDKGWVDPNEGRYDRQD